MQAWHLWLVRWLSAVVRLCRLKIKKKKRSKQVSLLEIWLLFALTSKFISSCSELTFSAQFTEEISDIKKPHQSYVPATLLCHWSIFFSVYPSLDAGKIRSDFHVKGGFRNYFQDHRRLPDIYTVIGGFLNAAITSLSDSKK
jgi:hypothetical protein